MYSDELHALMEKPLIARLATLSPDGYPHVVPLWYDVDGDDLVIISERATQKVRNLTANPKAAITVGGQPGDGGGWTFWGDMIVSDDTNHAWTTRITHRYEPKEEADKHLAEWRDFDMVVLRMKVKRFKKVFDGA
jgi:PPOX class probable F420-dependent enzyme